MFNEHQIDLGETAEPTTDPVRAEEKPKRRERDKSHLSPLIIVWEDDAGHKKTMRVEANRIHVPKCSLCKTKYYGRHYYVGTIKDEDDPDAYVTFDKKGAKDVQRSQLWKEFTALLDLIQGKDGAGQLTRRWCVKCAEKDHSGSCFCPCHRAQKYHRAVTEPQEYNVRDDEA